MNDAVSQAGIPNEAVQPFISLHHSVQTRVVLPSEILLTQIHVDDQARVFAALERTQATLISQQIVFRLVNAEGTLGWLQGEMQNAPAQSQEVLRIVGMQRATASSKESRESELVRWQNNERLIGELEGRFELAPTPMKIAYDREGTYIRGNAAALYLLRFPSLDLIQNISSGAPGEVRPTHFRFLNPDGSMIAPQDLPLQRAMSTGENIINRELKVEFQNGESVYLLANAAPLRQENGVVTGGVEGYHDISAQEQRISQQTEISRKIQNTLLLEPPPNAFPGVTIKTLYRASVEEARIGGDFFDIFALTADVVALVVGDATGKGVAAATYTAEVKFAFRAFLRTHRGDLSGAMSALNNFICQNRRLDPAHLGSSYIALIATLLNLRTGEFTSCSGGGEPPLLYRAATGTVEEINAQGMMLGVEDNADYPESRGQMKGSDLLTMTTDGLTEARYSNGDSIFFFGLEGVADALRDEVAYPLRPLPEIEEAIVARTIQWAKGKQQDDICLLMVRLIPI